MIPGGLARQRHGAHRHGVGQNEQSRTPSHPSQNQRTFRPAFTLIELLVVVAIIALLLSILLPALGSARSQAKTVVCASNMHQMLLAMKYYSDDMRGYLPWIPGWPPSYIYGPYQQNHQLLIMWPYLKNYKFFRCPSATGVNSVKSLFGKNLTLPPAGQTTNQSRYFVNRLDDYYENTAHANNWWPEFDPAKMDTDEFPELYTEYWYNDYSSHKVPDAAGQFIPKMNGGRIDAIPFGNYAVPLAEFDWYLESKQMRHNGGINLGFLDAHVERKQKKHFYDRLNGAAVRNNADVDPWGSSPFYCWGLTRYGRNF